MKPTYEEMLDACTKWNKTHKGLGYILSFHGYSKPESDFPHPGTWCYYLMVPEQMFPHRWKDFKCVRDQNGFEHPGSAFYDVNFYSGITWSSSEPYFCRKTMQKWDASKVGCDYSHSWDANNGYPADYNWVNSDAIKTVDEFLSKNPDFYLQCAWSGIWDKKENFYEAKNGSNIHKSREMEASKSSELWGPKK